MKEFELTIKRMEGSVCFGIYKNGILEGTFSKYGKGNKKDILEKIDKLMDE